jgi:hypothetical protein
MLSMALVGASLWAAGKDSPMKARLSETFQLKIGERVEITDTRLIVHLEKLGETPMNGGPPGGAEVFPVATATFTVTKDGQTKRAEVSKGNWLLAYDYLIIFVSTGKTPDSAEFRVNKSQRKNKEAP